ncbi:MAG: NAD(+) synthase [Clostridia bacterium]|nr:NAD(+) synthase [Clostridia bacterium]
MKNDFVKVATLSPKLKVCDVEFNVGEILKGITLALENDVRLIAFPELCITGYTAGDLFSSKTLTNGALKGLIEIAKFTTGKNIIVFVGLPFVKDGLIYNVCAGLSNGKILGLVPKNYLPNYSEFYEKRYFAPAPNFSDTVKIDMGEEVQEVPFYKNLIFADKNVENFKISAELCEDLWTAVPPSIYHAVNGARIIINLSASSESTGKPEKRRDLVKNHSQKIVSAYIYANAGEGESTTDCVFSGHSIIAENGKILAENAPFNYGLNACEIDLSYLDFERSKIMNQDFNADKSLYQTVEFSVDTSLDTVTRLYEKTPFITLGEEEFALDIAASGLAKRVEHTFSKKIVLGLSGGLDSTLALIVCARAMEKLKRPLKDVIAITMPCFGTSSRTLDNSIKLAKAFGVTLKKVDITKSVKSHLKDLNHDENVHDAAYENSQARERTQVLMDLANMENGLVVGTGDLSELALGWATYNGDHMSMYAVNGSVPKTLVRHLVYHFAENSKAKIRKVLLDILDTPVSPELIPSGNDTITQVTEDIVGPYVLHDFFLYNIITRGFTPKKLYLVACNTFKGEFTKETILKWLKTFIRRFFNQQFKRSCMPDGVKVTEVSLSPRSGWHMPSDAVSALWQKELEDL